MPPGATKDPSVRMIGWPSSVVTLRLLPVPTPERDLSELFGSPGEVRNVPVCITCDKEGRTCKTHFNGKFKILQLVIHVTEKKQPVEHVFKIQMLQMYQIILYGAETNLPNTFLNS
jgi:hypothetical protein